MTNFICTAVPESRNIALADSANVVQGDTLYVPSPKPILTDFGKSVNPRSSRFIGLLVAYILITLLVIYMVICAVCFQPRKCLGLVSRANSETDGEPTTLPSSSRTSRSHSLFSCRWLRSRSLIRQTAPTPLILPRTNPHFSRSVNGERFLHYPVHFGLMSNLQSERIESPAEHWISSPVPRSSSHPQDKQGSAVANSTWNPLNGAYSPLPTPGQPLSHPV